MELHVLCDRSLNFNKGAVLMYSVECCNNKHKKIGFTQHLCLYIGIL